MSDDRLKLRVTRSMCINGQALAAGTILSVPPSAAADAIDSGRAELIDPADRPAVLAGRQAEVMRQMRQAGGRLNSDPGSPWATWRGALPAR